MHFFQETKVEFFLILPDGIQLLHSFVPSCSESEKLAALVPAFTVGQLKLSPQVFALQTPLPNHLCVTISADFRG